MYQNLINVLKLENALETINELEKEVGLECNYNDIGCQSNAFHAYSSIDISDVNRTKYIEYTNMKSLLHTWKKNSLLTFDFKMLNYNATKIMN